MNWGNEPAIKHLFVDRLECSWTIAQNQALTGAGIKGFLDRP